MKSYLSLPVVLILICMTAPVWGQNVIEIKNPAASASYLEVKNEIEQLGDQNRDGQIGVLSSALSALDDPYERFDIIFNDLSFLYGKEGRYRECFDILKQGQEEGLFYPLMAGDRKWPEYVSVLDSMDGFGELLDKNNQLRDSARQKAQFEYIVKVPPGYRKDKKYPLLIALHGGFGNHIESVKYWSSPGLDSQFVVAALQGSDFRGSFLRRYELEDQSLMVETYRRLIRDYGIDTSRVILAGPSAGGAWSIMLAIDGQIPAAGLILAFPVRPRSFEDARLDTLAATGIRAAFLCGENDWAIKQQKEMGVLFDKHNIPNRFIIASGEGHNFPVDFSAEIDRSLEFIFRKP